MILFCFNNKQEKEKLFQELQIINAHYFLNYHLSCFSYFFKKKNKKAGKLLPGPKWKKEGKEIVDKACT